MRARIGTQSPHASRRRIILLAEWAAVHDDDLRDGAPTARLTDEERSTIVGATRANLEGLDSVGDHARPR